MAPQTATATPRERLLSHLQESAWLTKALYAIGFALITAALAQVRFYAPWNPYVPYTGQVLGVLGAGLILGPRTGSASMGIYLALGAIGLPVFADQQAGLEILLGATAGYLLAFPIAAWITGHLSRRYLDTPSEDLLSRLGLATLAGYLVLFGIGAALLGVFGVLATEGLGLTVLVSSAAIALLTILLWTWSRKESKAFLARLAIALIGVLAIYTVGWIGLAVATEMTWSAALAQGVIQFVPIDMAKAFLAAGATTLALPPEAA